MQRYDRIVSGDDGRAVFMRCPIGEWEWSFAVDDNAVHDRGPGEGWLACTESLTEFLIHNALTELPYGVRYWRCGTRIRQELLPEVIGPMSEVALKPWRWPREVQSRIFMNDRMIAEIDIIPDNGGFDVRVASQSGASLGYLDRLTDIKWIS